MLIFPNIDPVLIHLGPLAIHWYGVMYLVAFASALWLGNRRAAAAGFTKDQVSDLVFLGALGAVLGGRMGYILFYQFEAFLAQPMMLLRVWEGGMSFHGGLIGVAVALLIYSRKYQITFLSLTDFATPLVPTGLFFGRIGNFIGQELYGRPTDVPWAMIFPADPQQLARHPSQLYEAALEGLVLFFIINWYARKPRLYGEVTGLFLMLYGAFRFTIEFVRQPDAQFAGQSALMETFNWMTRGQTLCIPMILLGMWFMRASIRGTLGQSSVGKT